MKALNPFEGEFYRETLQVSRYTREMFCLMEGRHVHPSTLYPGGVGTVPSIQLFTDYTVRLMRYIEFMKRGCRCMTIFSTSFMKRCLATKKSAAGVFCSDAGDRSRIRMCATTIIARWKNGVTPCMLRPALSSTAN